MAPSFDLKWTHLGFGARAGLGGEKLSWGGSPNVTVAATACLRPPLTTWFWPSAIAPSAIVASPVHLSKRPRAAGTGPAFEDSDG